MYYSTHFIASSSQSIIRLPVESSPSPVSLRSVAAKLDQQVFPTDFDVEASDGYVKYATCYGVLHWNGKRLFTGPPRHSVGTLGVCNTCICNVTHPGAARDGGPVMLRPVRTTPCFYCVNHYKFSASKWRCLSQQFRETGLVWLSITWRNIYIIMHKHKRQGERKKNLILLNLTNHKTKQLRIKGPTKLL